MSEQTENQNVPEEVVENTVESPVSLDDGVIKVNLGELNKPKEDAIPEQEANASDVPVEQPKDESNSEEVVQEVREPVQNEEQSVLEEITEEEVQEQADDLQDNIVEAIEEQRESGVELPENIQKVVDFMNETSGTLEDYVKLNKNYEDLDESQLLREYYANTKPHLDPEDIDFMMEDNFLYDEDLDDERDIRRKKLARREELAKAKNKTF